jgi:hypothetical protein
MAINTSAKTNGTIAAPVTPALDMAAIIQQAVQQAVAQATTSMTAEVAKLKAENAKLATAPKPEVPLTIRVSAKGAVSIYGCGRFPVTLYKSQWLRIFAIQDKVKSFMLANDKDLKSKE